MPIKQIKKQWIDVKDVKHEQIDEQIEIRKKLISELVGDLYPRIVSAEIEKLKKMKNDFIKESEMDV